uniref:Globin domain-containing protein n=2 Tax=Hemiselmis andersenii TaxID=464988 RepID=A0A7S1DKS7_HEMAN|mmetsp:Transcript_17735/g.42816  ORF Transcript_17735/g.42816 Transcript_17735/m.42816 type:complete len:1417 (+) Transcript_17735:428-4678(+)
MDSAGGADALAASLSAKNANNGKSTSPLGAARGVAAKAKQTSTLAPIGAGETDGGELPAFSHPQVLDAQGNLSLTCPMTGNAFNLSGATGGMSAIEALKNSAAAPAPAEPSDATAQLARQGSMAGSVARRAARRDNDGGSQAGSRASGSRVGSKMGGSRASKGTRNKSTAKTGSRKGGGGVMGGAVSRRERGVPKRKPPPWDDADVAKHAPVVKASWNRCLEVKGYFELGNLYYDTLFDEAPELSPMFTLERERMGVKFVDMLAAMVSVIDSPPGMHSKLESLAPMHIDRGVKATDMPIMGKVLFSVLAKAMGSEFTEPVQEAWGWVWAWLTKSMTLTLETAGGHNSLVLKSWDICMDNYTEEDLGGMLFDTLFELAPSLKSMFARPRPVMAMKFVEMVSTLVSFVDDESRMIEQINWLGSRHVKYGAKPHHIPIMGQVLLTVLEQSCGDEWTDEMANAWMDLWNASCARMMAAIKSGEQYGHVVESLWDKVQKKSSPTVLGSGLVRKLARTRSDLVRSFVVDRREWLEEKKVEIEEAMEKKAKADKAAKKTEKATSANSLVISTDAPPAPEYKARKMDGVLSSLKKALRKGASPTTELSSRHSLDEEEAHEVKDDKVDDSKKSVAGKGEDSKCRARRVQYSKVGEEEQVDAWGTEIYDMLHVVMDLLWEPEQMNERLTVTTHHFFSLGIRSAHLDTIGMAIHTTLERVMERSWEQKHSDAWKWFWAMVATQMRGALDVLESGDVEVIRQSWEDAKSSKPAEELGEIFFKELARIAPHVTHLFKRPKRIQALQFTNVIEMLVSFNEDPQQFFLELKPLTIRHIKYGVKADYARAFGMTVLNGISSVLGDRFDERVKGAWVLLWTRVSSCVTRSLNVGSNLVIVSLVQENLEQLEDAMDCVPRGERDEVLTKIDVNGEIISPLNWAISGGQLSMAQFVMGDLLAIRADRYRYYYGRETLFKTHPDLVQCVARQMPALLDNLFDGLLWHAQMVQDGRVRVNYYIREMYGVPEEVKDVWTSPMGVLVLAGQSVVFNHPVMEKLLEVKWERFGLKIYAGIQIWYCIMLILFTLGFVTYQNSCAPSAEYIRLVTGGMASLTLLLQTVVLCYQFRSGQVSRCNSGFKHMPDIVVPRFLMNPWNSARYISSAMLIANAFMDLACMDNLRRGGSPQQLGGDGHDDPLKREHGINVLGAVTAIFIWLQLIQVLILSERMAAFTYTVGRMVKDFAQNFTVIIVVMVAFSAAMTILEAPGGYSDGLGSSIFNVLKISIGLAPHEAIEQESWAMACLVVLTIIVNIGFLNILVAQLVLAYASLSTDQEGCAKMNRAYICVEMESFLSLKYRQKLYDELSFDEPLEFDSSDEGPCGGIQSLCPSTVRSHPKYVPDRVQRFTGEASVMDPWPSAKVEEEEVDDGNRDDMD